MYEFTHVLITFQKVIIEMSIQYYNKIECTYQLDSVPYRLRQCHPGFGSPCMQCGHAVPAQSSGCDYAISKGSAYGAAPPRMYVVKWRSIRLREIWLDEPESDSDLTAQLEADTSDMIQSDWLPKLKK